MLTKEDATVRSSPWILAQFLASLFLIFPAASSQSQPHPSESALELRPAPEALPPSPDRIISLGPSARVGPGLSLAFDRDQERREAVLVHLRFPGNGPHPDFLRNRAAYRRGLAEAQERVLASLKGEEFRLRHRFQNVPGLAGDVTAQGLARLSRHPLVQAVVPDREVRPMLAEGKGLIRADAAQARGWTGAGQTVAVLDTGVDLTHPDFADTTVSSGWDFGDDDADASDDCACGGHGTAVAGIIARPDGVAPGAGIVSLKIARCSDCVSQQGNIAAAIDWCITNQATYGISVINISFGSYGLWESPCDGDDPVTATAADNATGVGISIFASAGNDGLPNTIASPACLTSVNAVGAVYDAAIGSRSYGVCTDGSTAADQVTCYSNSSPDVRWLAPSHCANTTERSQGYSSASCFGGTSAASPYTAGAAALLREAFPSLDPEGVGRLLVESGDPVLDPKSVRLSSRINLEQALDRGPRSPEPPDTRFVPGAMGLLDDDSYLMAWMLHPDATSYDIHAGDLTRPWSYAYEELACDLPSWKWWLTGIPRRAGKNRYYLVTSSSAGGRTAGRDSMAQERPLPSPCPSGCNRPPCTGSMPLDLPLVLSPGAHIAWVTGKSAAQHYWARLDWDPISGNPNEPALIGSLRAVVVANDVSRQGFWIESQSTENLFLRARLQEIDPNMLGPIVVDETRSLASGESFLALVSSAPSFPYLSSLAVTTPSSSGGIVYALDLLYWDGSQPWRAVYVTNGDSVPHTVNLRVRGAGGLQGSEIWRQSDSIPPLAEWYFDPGPFDAGEPWTWFDAFTSGPFDAAEPYLQWADVLVYDGNAWYDSVYVDNPGNVTTPVEAASYLYDECCD